MDVTLNIQGRLLRELQLILAQTNQAQGMDLDLPAWILLHLQEIAISRDLAKAVENVRKGVEEMASVELDKALRAERARLLQEMEHGPD